MSIFLPSNCTGEDSWWSYGHRLLFLLTEKARGEQKNLQICYGPEVKAIHALINASVKIAMEENHWNPRVPDHVSGGVIHYPSGLNQENEGSRAICLIGLVYLLHSNLSSQQDDKDAVSDALEVAQMDAIALYANGPVLVGGQEWNPSLEDITVGT